MNKEIEIPEGYKARIEGNKVILELKDNEDERIRKELIKLLNFLPEGIAENYTAVSLKDFVAYLEKQKKKKPVECIEFDNEFKNQVSHLLASILNREWEYSKGFVEHIAQQLLGYAKHEISPEEWNEDTICKAVKEVGLTQHQINWFENNVFPPKQEWSEEDEKMRFRIIGHLSSFIYTNSLYGDDAKECIAWLKSLHPQPKAELTLLDNNIIEAAVAFVEQNDHFNCWRGIDKHTIIKALRSLHPQPSWKPSKEQMKYFETALFTLEGLVGEEMTVRVLDEIRKELKKLVED